MSDCARCGAELGVGRFCVNCGHPIDAPPPEGLVPSHVEIVDDWRTGTAERPAIPPPAYGTPASHRHAAPRTHASRPPWVPVAAGIVAMLLVAGMGAWLLFGGEDDERPVATDRTSATPEPTEEPTPSEDPTSEEPTPTEEPSNEPGEPANVARSATATVPATAEPNQDTEGNVVRYEGSNMLDGVPETTWRMPGDGTGETLTFDFDSPVEILAVGLINGYAKTATDGGQSFDWYAGNRRVLAVEWLFDDGTLVRQDLEETRALQQVDVDPVTTESVQVRLVTVSAPGTGPASRDYTAISEVSLVGTLVEG